MNFIQKLTEETKNGNLDFIWKYNDGAKSYTFVYPKHPMNGLNFSLLNVKGTGEIVFPNGGATNFSKESLKELERVVIESIIRTMDSIKKDYTSGVIDKDLQAQEKEVEDKKEEVKENKTKDKVVKKV